MMKLFIYGVGLALCLAVSIYSIHLCLDYLAFGGPSQFIKAFIGFALASCLGSWFASEILNVLERRRYNTIRKRHLRAAPVVFPREYEHL